MRSKSFIPVVNVRHIMDDGGSEFVYVDYAAKLKEGRQSQTVQAH